MNWIKGYNHKYVRLGNGIVDAYIGLAFGDNNTKWMACINGKSIEGVRNVWIKILFYLYYYCYVDTVYFLLNFCIPGIPFLLDILDQLRTSARSGNYVL